MFKYSINEKINKFDYIFLENLVKIMDQTAMHGSILRRRREYALRRDATRRDALYPTPTWVNEPERNNSRHVNIRAKSNVAKK